MSSVLTHSDPISLSASPHSLISTSASLNTSSLTSSGINSRRVNRPCLRSVKTDSKVATQTIPEGEELLGQSPAFSIHPSRQHQQQHSSQALNCPRRLPIINPVTNTSSQSSLCPPLSSIRGLDHDHLLGPRRSSASSSLRNDRSSSSLLSQPAPTPILPSTNNLVFYSSSPTTPWPSISQVDQPIVDPKYSLSSPRPRSSTTPSSASSASLVSIDPLKPSHQLTSNPPSNSQPHFVNSRSNSTPVLPLLLHPSSSPDPLPKRLSHSISSGSTNNQPITLRPRADSYAHGGWKTGWSTGGGTSGPLDYLPNLDSVPNGDRKSWLVPSPTNSHHSLSLLPPSLNDGPQSVIPRSLSHHDLHTFPDSHPSHLTHPRYSPHPQLPPSSSTSSIFTNATATSSLYSEPLPGPHLSNDSLHHSLNLNSLVGSAPSFHPPQRPIYSDQNTQSAIGVCTSSSGFNNPQQQPSSGPRTNTRIEPLVEEISTIFVVGFPDDMNEREFQNMFMFSHGFEAATLKVPASTLAARERDMTAAVVAAAAVANSTVMSPSGVPFGPNPSHRLSNFQPQNTGGVLIDQFGMPLLGIDGFDEFANPISLDPQFRHHHHPLALGAGTSGGSGPLVSGCLAPNLHGIMDLQASVGGLSNRKQIIGFAKFKTRVDALHARDVLSGRKVDAEKGHVLKAEMAKKNLHTKRGLSNEIGSTTHVVSSTQINHSSSIMSPTTVSPQTTNPLLVNDIISYPLSIRSDPINSNHLGLDLKMDSIAANTKLANKEMPSNLQSIEDQELSTNGLLESDLTYWQINKGISNLEVNGPSKSSSCQPEPVNDLVETSEAPCPNDPSRTQNDLGKRTGVNSDWTQNTSPMIEASLGKSLWQKLEEDEESMTLADNTKPLTNGIALEFEGIKVDGASSGSSGSVGSNGSLKGNNTKAINSGSATSWIGSAATRNHYPADQNPAINTLYVGGLPSVIEGSEVVPSGGGLMMMMMRSEELESALRRIFGKVEGFKRLSYKVKNQQPMCFIEFETVEHASRAMEKMYGDKIEGKIPGGIRLAYSRNALGVRSTGSSSCSSVNSCQLAVNNF
ncbi:hypothetical protein O181_056050 [Austropuccinia psidii MF-1]|uniref:RRM domain-containing protein n=1 Tax=Austropuccinia psidii MF-1 TaxID=1389203 RepID=A0A9Q3EBZ3_9BASI|nr:hypothetical protein [Austropuccinia psidii MF-1]